MVPYEHWNVHLGTVTRKGQKQSKTKDATVIPLSLVRFSLRGERKGNPPKSLRLGSSAEYSGTHPFIYALRKHAP